MNPYPYTNAARAGRTRYGFIETIGPEDPRHRSYVEPVVPNRAALRARGIGITKPVRLRARRRPVTSTTTEA